MDPNETLRRLRLLAIEGEDLAGQDPENGFDPDIDERISQIALEMSELFQDLDNWILKGGFLPRTWGGK